MKKNVNPQIVLRIIVTLGLLFIPTFSFASGPSAGFADLGSLVDSFTNNVIRALVSLLTGTAMVTFFYGIVQYIWGLRNGDATKAKTGSSFMVWGVIALFVMMSIWGIVIFIQRIFRIEGQNTIIIPTIQVGALGSASPSAGASGAPSAGVVSSPGSAGATPTSCAGLPANSACRLRDGSTGFCASGGCTPYPLP